MGRIVEPKGVHLAIGAVREYNRQHQDELVKLKIAGKHYAGHSKDLYWQEQILPELGGEIEYAGFIRGDEEKRRFLANARALIMPSTFAEPFGLVMAEALACGTPIVGLNSGAVAEVVRDGETGLVVKDASELVGALGRISEIDRGQCRADFEGRFTLERMVREHAELYKSLV
jgi:glycosyltransferase involved in cell wall biosynthesis